MRGMVYKNEADPCDSQRYKGRVLTIGTDAKVLCAMINNITSDAAQKYKWVSNPTHRQELNAIAGGARKLYPFRNRLAHGTWQHKAGQPNNVRLHFNKDGDERLMPRHDKTLDAARIAREAGILRNLNFRALKLWKELSQP